MKRRFAFLSALMIAVIVAIFNAPGALGQNLKSGRADVPFPFSANHQELPAGCYQVKLLSNEILGLVNCDTGMTIGVMVHTANGYPTVQNGSLVFRDTGHKYRLIRVRFAGVNIQSDLSIQPRPEMNSARNEERNTTEIAMN